MNTQSAGSDQHAFVGIDFGTTKTMVANYDSSKKSAKPLTLGRGKFEKPTSMYATESGELLFGDDADDEGIADLPNHIRRFKMKLGKPGLAHVGRKSGTALQLTSEFLVNVRTQLENQVLHTSASRVILTVPAMFGPAQRRELTAAARQAGFSQVELLEEPVAAGIAYCDQQSDLSKQLRFIVVDWGGGTFDVAHLERSLSGEIKVYQDFVVGLDDIGGEVFDDELWNIASNALAAVGYGTLESQPRENWGRFRRDLSRAKESLSSQSSVTMTFALAGGQVAKVSLNREDFGAVISPMIQKAASFVTQLIVRAHNAGCPPEFILLAGGTSRIPLIAAEFERITGVKCRQWSDGRESIALGAAIKAGHFWGQQATAQSHIGKSAALSQYQGLLETAFLDKTITPEERAFLGKKRKALGLTIEESTSLQVKVLGASIGDVIQRIDDASNKRRNAPIEIHISKGGQQFGPYSESEIRRQLDSGEIDLSCLAWHEGLSNWMPLSQTFTNSVPISRMDAFNQLRAQGSRFKVTLAPSDVGLQVAALAPEAHPDIQGDEFIRRTHFPVAYLVSIENTSNAEINSVRVTLKSSEGQQHSILIPSIKPGTAGALSLTTADFEGWMVTPGDTLTVDATGLDATIFAVTEDECAAIDNKRSLNMEVPVLVLVRKAAFSSNFVLRIRNIQKQKIKITGFQSPAGSIQSSIEIAPDAEAEIGWCELSGGRNLATNEEFRMSIQDFKDVQGVLAEGQLKGSGAIWTVLGALGGIAIAVAGG